MILMLINVEFMTYVL